jgi:flagellar hook-associated protein FlgK
MGGTGTDPVRLVTAVGGYTLTTGGQAAGQLTGLNGIYPTYQKELDTLAGELATSINDLHDDGFDKLGNPGGAVFDTADGSPITAANIRVAIIDPQRLAASGVPGAPNNDNSNADKIAQLRTLTQGPDANYRKTVVRLGVEASVANRNVEIQSVITTQIDAARESVAGVNIDEEMTNMLSYQHAYSAAGRLITTIDEMLNKLINGTGRVGL